MALDIPTLNLPDGDLSGGSLTLTGSSTPGSEVGIVVDGEMLGTTYAGDDGSWSFETDLEAGDYAVRLQAIDIEGNVAAESNSVALSLGLPTVPEFY